jgi:uncharacterized protein (TIGR00369 family)
MNTDQTLALEFWRDPQPRPISSNPLARALRGTLMELDAGTGHALLAFDPSAEFVQDTGHLQGGIVTAMLDFAMAFAVLAKLSPDSTFSTASISVNFIAPSPPGKYLARGRIDRLGGRLIFASAEMHRDEDKKLVATATAVLVHGRSESGCRT